MTNLATPLWEHARRHPERVALRSAGAVVTYGALWRQAQAYADELQVAGTLPGSRAVLIAPSVPAFASMFMALQAIGVVVVPMNTMSTSDEIDYVVSDAGAELVVVWHECSGPAEQVARTRELAFRRISPFDVPSPADLVAELHGSHADDTAVILYTSGTTGRPKGTELTVGNLETCAELAAGAFELTAEDRLGTALPLFHVFGLANVMMAALAAGASLSLVSPFDPTIMLNVIRDDELTVVLGVPTMWNALVQAGRDLDGLSFEHVRLGVSGGASLPADVLRTVSDQFGCAVREGYGLTETAGTATFNLLSRPAKPGTVGVAMPRSSVEVRNDDGDVLRSGDVGEIHLSGPTVMKGYWRRPRETSEVLHQGWLRTGDLGSLDDDGYLTIVDRSKDLIIRGGYNVYPREVEEVLHGHPDIIEVAVLGIPDDFFGEEVAAVVVLRAGAVLDVAALREWAKVRLSAYKVPRRFATVEALPKGSTGKVLKRAIDRPELVTDKPASQVHQKKGR